MVQIDQTRAAARQSALAHLTAAPADGAGLRLAELRPSAIVQVAAWPDTLPGVKRALGELLGSEIPRLGFAVAGPGGTVAALAPGRYLVAAGVADLATRLSGAITADQAAVTDLTHGRTILSLAGEAAPAILAKGLAIDLHPSVFPPGRVAQSMIHHIDVTVHRLELHRFELTVLRGFAEDFVEWLMDAGMEFGIGFAGPA
jgi:sarcosine oxidase subunit gamma